MFILDSLMISGISWALRTVVTAAEAEMNDDTALREALLEAEMRREMGEISDDEFGDLEADLLARIREIKERREGGSGPLAFGGAQPMETSPDSRFQVEASVSGDFYDPADAPHTTVVEHDPGEGMLLRADEDEQIRVLDMEPGEAEAPAAPSLPLTHRSERSGRSDRSDRSNRSNRSNRSGSARSSSASGDATGTARTRTTRTRTPRTPRTSRTSRTTRTTRTKK